MVCLSRAYPIKFFKGCLPQILLGLFLNTLSQIRLWLWTAVICKRSHSQMFWKKFGKIFVNIVVGSLNLKCFYKTETLTYFFCLEFFTIFQFRSRHPGVFLRQGVLKICSKFTGEHLYQSVIFATLLKLHFGIVVLL